MKRIIFGAVTALVLALKLVHPVDAGEVFEFDLSEGMDSKAMEEVNEALEALPEEITEDLPKKDRLEVRKYDADYFFELLKSGLKEALSPTLRTVTRLLSYIIIAALFHILSDNITSSGMKNAFSLCSSLCIALSIFSAMRDFFSIAETLLEALSQTMLAIVPAMEAVYISSGNLTSATVLQTGVSLMIGFTQTVFSRVLSPMSYGVFVLGVAAAVSENAAVAFMSRVLKGAVTGILIIMMTVMTFVLALQSSGASAADGLMAKTLKFAIGSYIPIIGSSVADSFSLLSGSMGVIKQGCGAVGIAVLLIAFVPPFFIMLMNRFSLGLCSSLSEVLGCKREGRLLGECKGIATLLIAICTGATVMYIIALGIFCRTAPAVS